MTTTPPWLHRPKDRSMGKSKKLGHGLSKQHFQAKPRQPYPGDSLFLSNHLLGNSWKFLCDATARVSSDLHCEHHENYIPLGVPKGFIQTKLSSVDCVSLLQIILKPKLHIVIMQLAIWFVESCYWKSLNVFWMILEGPLGPEYIWNKVERVASCKISTPYTRCSLES